MRLLFLLCFVFVQTPGGLPAFFLTARFFLSLRPRESVLADGFRLFLVTDLAAFPLCSPPRPPPLMSV